MCLQHAAQRSLERKRKECVDGGGGDRRKESGLRFATWNVRTLVERQGPARVAAVSAREPKEDKKIYLVVRELRRLGIEVAGLQESRWFGSDFYNVDDALVLSSGRPVPSENFQRREGVCLLVRGRGKLAFEAGGSQWTAVSSRLLVGCLKFDHCKSPATWIHGVVCYAPTFRTPRDKKDLFFDQLQECLSSIPRGHQVIILGDFNAHVGSSLGEDGLWQRVRGRYGIGVENDAGRRLLSF